MCCLCEFQKEAVMTLGLLKGLGASGRWQLWRQRSAVGGPTREQTSKGSRDIFLRVPFWNGLEGKPKVYHPFVGVHLF